MWSVIIVSVVQRGNGSLPICINSLQMAELVISFLLRHLHGRTARIKALGQVSFMLHPYGTLMNAERKIQLTVHLARLLVLI